MAKRPDEHRRSELSKDKCYPALVVVEDNITFKIRKRIDIWDGNSEDERNAFCEALLKISWLPAKIRRAVMAELGLSLRAENRKINQARATMLQALIAKRKVQMRKNGDRPSGGIHEAAVEETAHEQGIKIPTMKQFIRRYGLKGEQRRQLQAYINQRYGK
jgi:hypothetical protein